MADDLITRTRAEIDARLQELRPLVAEAEQLERALAALEGIGPAPESRPSGSPRGRQAGREAQGVGARSDQFLAIVRESPGITVAEAAKRLGMGPNYLYRIARTLEGEGTIERQGRGYVAPGHRGVASPGETGPTEAPPTGRVIPRPGTAA